MRKFSSYGPILTSSEYYVPRIELIEAVLEQLVGERPQETGHYITIWAPRQRGKTWVLQQAMHRIRTEKQYTQFDVAKVNLQTRMDPNDPVTVAKYIVSRLGDVLEQEFPVPDSMDDFEKCFTQTYLDEPLILILDEFDGISHNNISALIQSFRNIYVERRDDEEKNAFKKKFRLHSVALIGVQGVLGEGNPSGSPFNVQRSINIPNLTYDEVTEMYHWYAKESGQPVEKSLIDRVYYETTGQPGLVSWFGELVTEKFNRTPDQPLTANDFDWMFVEALNALPNANLLNIVSKANMPEHKPLVLELFQTNDKVPFKYGDSTQTFLYLNGVIDYEREEDATYVKFANPFVQKRLFNSFESDILPHTGQLHPPFEDISDTITADSLNVGNLLRRYEIYLQTNRDWLLRDAPRRKTDLRIYEAVYHFNLYAFLLAFVRFGNGHVRPEFPTGNGKIDLFIEYAGLTHALELKSFANQLQYANAIVRAAEYAQQMEMGEIWLVFFVDAIDDASRARLEVDHLDESTNVTVRPIFLATQ